MPCPVSGIATSVFGWQHTSVDVVLQVVPSFLTAALKAFNMPANTEVIHKVGSHDNNPVGMADLHELTGFSTPLISKQAVNIDHHDRFDLAFGNPPEHVIEGFSILHEYLA